MRQAATLDLVTRRQACHPRGTCALLLLSLVLAAAGCARPVRHFQPAVAHQALGDTAFLHYLATVPVATVDEGCRAVLLLTERDPLPDTFEARRAVLVEMGALREDWPLSADQQLDRGTLAHMLRTVCDLPRGLNETIFSPVGIAPRRFALRACVHAELLPPGPEHAPVSGGALLAAFSAAEKKTGG